MIYKNYLLLYIMTYYVPDGNWTSNVANSLGNNSVDVLTFTPNVDAMDPAVACEKGFEATYKCGLSTSAKTISINKPADGKTARFDCAAESTACNDLKLTLTDDGKLTLTNLSGTKPLWDSVTAFGPNGAFPSTQAPIAVAANAGNGTPNSAVDVGVGGGPGRRYKDNFLLSGQFLESGQWIGSPTGTCRLMMGTSQTPNSLQVVRSVPNCDELDIASPIVPTSTLSNPQAPYSDLGCWKASFPQDLKYESSMPYDNNPKACYEKAKSQGHTIFALQNSGACFIADKGQDPKKYGKHTINKYCPSGGLWYINHVYQINGTTVNTNTDAARLYTIPTIFNENIGKAGYVNDLGQLKLYPDTMTSYGNKFDEIGNYSSAGGVLASFGNSTLEECQTKCSNGSYPDGSNDKQKCAGFVFDTTGAMCKILDKTLGQQQRIIKPTARYFARQKGIIGQDISCPADVTIQGSGFWNSTQKVSDMSTATKCGLANFVENERTKVRSELPEVMKNIQYKDADGNLSEAIKYADISGNAVLLDKNKNGFKYWFERLQDKYNILTGNLFSTKDSIKNKMDELEESKKDLADWTGEQLQNLQAMTEDRDLNMMSQNYRHILWSILAIIIIIGTLKMTKTNAAA